MAKGKNNDLMPTLAGIFSFFVVFLRCLSMLSGSSWRIGMLLMPSLWLLFGLCLMTKRKNWLTVVGMLPLVILTVQGAWAPIPMNEVKVFLSAVVCRILPAAAMVVLFVLLLLSCLQVAGKFRREMWLLPVLLLLPSCVWQHGSTMVWAELGVVASMAFWLKPAGK